MPGVEEIPNAGSQGGFGADDREVHALCLGKIGECFEIVDIDGGVADLPALGGRARVTRCDQDCFDLRRTRNRPGQGMLAAPGTYDHHLHCCSPR